MREAGNRVPGRAAEQLRWESISEFLQGSGEPGSGAGMGHLAVGRGTMVAGGGGGRGGAVVRHPELDDSTPSLHPLRSAGLRVKCCSNSLCNRNRNEEETARIGSGRCRGQCA